jgi:hypothetical protein
MNDRELILAAAKLARTAPENWNEFLGALAAHTDNQISNCISSPLEALPQNQGRAQSMVALLKVLRECLKTADQIEGKRR